MPDKKKKSAHKHPAKPEAGRSKKHEIADKDLGKVSGGGAGVTAAGWIELKESWLKI